MDVGSNVYILDDYQEFVLTVLFLQKGLRIALWIAEPC